MDYKATLPENLQIKAHVKKGHLELIIQSLSHSPKEIGKQRANQTLINKGMKKSQDKNQQEEGSKTLGGNQQNKNV